MNATTNFRELMSNDSATPGLIVRVASHTWAGGQDFAVTRIAGGELIGVGGEPIAAGVNLDALQQAGDDGDLPESVLNPEGGAHGWIRDAFGGYVTFGSVRIDREAWVSEILEYALSDSGNAREAFNWASEEFGVTQEEWESELGPLPAQSDEE